MTFVSIPDKNTLIQNMELIWNFVVADLKVRYKNSKLGFLWSLLNPLFMTLIYLLVFTTIMKFRTQNYSMFLLLGIVLWRFFAEGTQFALTSLVRKGQLIRKIYFPRAIVVISSTISSFIGTILELVAFFIIFFVLGGKFSFAFLILPLILLAEFILVLGVGFSISTIYVFFRDYDDIWKLTMRAGFYLTPVIWPLSALGDDSTYLPYIMINPMSRIVTMARSVVIDGKIPSFESFFTLLIICLVVYFLGIKIFKKYERRLAREV